MPEPLSIQFLSPANDAVLREDRIEVQINASANHADARIDKVELFAGNQQVATTTEVQTNPAIVTLEWDVSNLPNATYELEAKVYDNRGNTKSSQIQVQLHRQLRVQITSPQDGQIINSNQIPVTVTIKTIAADIVEAILTVDGAAVVTKTQAPWEFTWDTAGYPLNQEYHLQVTIEDADGNTAQSNVVTICVGCEIPPLSLAIISPQAGEQIEANQISVSGTVTSNIGRAIERVTLIVNDSPVAERNQAPWEFIWDTTSYPDSTTCTLFIEAEDEQGNVAQSEPVTVCVRCVEQFSRQRVVVQEQFTGAWCQNCLLYADPAADALAEEFGPTQLLSVHYHIRAGLFDDFEIAEGVARLNYYALNNSLPHAVFDGSVVITGGDPSTEDVYRQQINTQLADEPPVGILLTGTLGAGEITAKIKAFEQLANPGLTVQFVITESDLTHPSPPIHFNYVVRDMLPPASITLPNEGDQTEVSRSFVLDDSWNMDEIQLVVFVQDDNTKVILQGQAIWE
ncbi:MAG: hypothetical protein D6675_01730 [Gemmatimonadetes bacterium]|nr:MAG: hypothetical protein D6675_01730 [Gemmatimonadota bacterium]